MGTLGPSFLTGVETRFKFVAEPEDDRRFLGVDGTLRATRELLEAFKLATRAGNVGPQVIDRHGIKVRQEDAGWLVVTLCGHGVLRHWLGAAIVDDAGGKARALGPCLPARQKPQSGPKAVIRRDVYKFMDS